MSQIQIGDCDGGEDSPQRMHNCSLNLTESFDRVSESLLIPLEGE